MKTQNSKRIAVVASGMMLAFTFVLSGCATDNSAAPASDPAPQDSNMQIDFNSEMEANWAELPKNWPAGIPLVSEQITGSNYGSSPDGEDWTVDILPKDLQSEFSQARLELTSGGFIEESWGSTEGLFSSDTHKIVLSTAVGDFGDDVVRYFVTPVK